MIFEFHKGEEKRPQRITVVRQNHHNSRLLKIVIVYPQQDEDYDYDDEGEPLLREGEGLAEEVELTLATDGHIDKLYD